MVNRPETGEILAMANRPNFDLNLRAQAKPEQMKNRAIIDMMEPGSTFKIVTAAAAINEHKFSLDSYIFCENGIIRAIGEAHALLPTLPPETNLEDTRSA